MCIIRAILKWCLREISDVNYISEYLRLNRITRLKRSFKSVIYISGGERVVPLDRFSLVRVAIYKSPFSSQRIVLVELSKAHFEGAEWAASFKK